jgi:hypothetical protein
LVSNKLLRLLWPKPLVGKTVVFLLFAGIVLLAVFQWSIAAGTQRLEEAWKLSNEFGLPNEFEPLLGERVADRDNASLALDEATSIARHFIQAEEKRLNYPNESALLEESSFIASMDRLLAETQYERQLADADLRADYSSRVVHTKPLYLSDVTHLKDRKWLASAELTIAKRLTSQGRHEEAVTRLVRLIRLTRRLEDREPFLVVAFVGVSARGRAIHELNVLLRAGPLPASVHDEVENELAKTEDILKALPRIAQFEKLSSVEFRDNTPIRGNAFLVRTYADDDRAFMVRHIHESARTYDRPFFEVSDELKRLESDWLNALNDPIRRHIFHGTRFALPAIKHGRLGFDRLIALSRCARVVNAMAGKGDFALILQLHFVH